MVTPRSCQGSRTDDHCFVCPLTVRARVLDLDLDLLGVHRDSVSTSARRSVNAVSRSSTAPSRAARKPSPATPEGSPDGMELGPAPDTLAIDLGGLGKHVQDAVGGLAEVLRHQ